MSKKKKKQRSAKLNNETNDYTQTFHGSFIGKSLVNVTSHIFLEFRREHFQLLQNNYKGPLGNFRVTLCLGLKTSLRTRHSIYEDEFDLHEKKNMYVEHIFLWFIWFRKETPFDVEAKANSKIVYSVCSRVCTSVNSVCSAIYHCWIILSRNVNNFAIFYRQSIHRILNSYQSNLHGSTQRHRVSWVSQPGWKTTSCGKKFSLFLTYVCSIKDEFKIIWKVTFSVNRACHSKDIGTSHIVIDLYTREILTDETTSSFA